MTTNPCTACKHFKPELTCNLTGLSTSQSRAYKTDEDDCFDSRWTAVEASEKQHRDHMEKLEGMTEQERREYLYGDFNKDGE